MNINQRIITLMEKEEKSPSEFADFLDIPRSSISHIISGRNKPSLDFLTKVKSTFPDVSWDWLIMGEGEMLISEQNKKRQAAEPEKIVPTPLPDLFTYVNKEVSESKPMTDIPSGSTTASRVEDFTARESAVEGQPLSETNIVQSQTASIPAVETPVKEETQEKISRIIVLYSTGRFESFQP